MAIAFVNIGAKGSGTTTVSLAHPASTGANQILLAGRCAWEPAISFTGESGWIASGEDLSTGTGTASDAHLTGIRADRREISGAEAGPTVFDQTLSGQPGCIGCMLSYSKAAGNTWGIATTTGDDATHGANRSIAAVGNIDFRPGDMLVAFAASDDDAATGLSAPALTASGITFGTTTRRTPNTTGNGAGDNGNIEAFDALVSSGSGVVAPTLAFTAALTTCGGAVFVRLRENKVVFPRRIDQLTTVRM